MILELQFTYQNYFDHHEPTMDHINSVLERCDFWMHKQRAKFQIVISLRNNTFPEAMFGWLSSLSLAYTSPLYLAVPLKLSTTFSGKEGTMKQRCV